MSTRSAIGISHGGRVKAIYNHYDGYPEYTGLILHTCYGDSVSVNKLISMGDMSQLGTEIGTKHDSMSRSEYVGLGGVEVARECTFYTRDRGEDTSWLSLEDSAHFTREYKTWGAEYFYLFKNDQWYVKSLGGGWRLLSRVLRELNKNS